VVDYDSGTRYPGSMISTTRPAALGAAGDAAGDAAGESLSDGLCNKILLS
jgi:hypothetical protein